MDAPVLAEVAVESPAVECLGGDACVQDALALPWAMRSVICVLSLLIWRKVARKGRGPMAVTGIDDTVHTRALAALAMSPFYELRELQVEQRDDVLSISGSVSSFYHKQLAQEAVRSVCADIKVINSIRVASEEDIR